VEAVQPVFYYDLGSPDCYLAAEQVNHSLAVVPEWVPVLGSELGHPQAEVDRERIERQARELGIQPLRWPASWPPDSRQATLAATYAKRIGRAVAFSLAAFRQVFAAGLDLGDQNTVLVAGAACEMHPSALLKGMALRATRQALTDAVEQARRAGVTELPAVVS
jgi:2-hydroxychromene-2-carboxylate isomerase